MYATLRIYREAEGLADAITEHESEIVALLRGIDGFRSYYLIRTGPASATSVSVYEDQAGAEASTQAARDWIAANLADLSISPPEVLVGEVGMAA